MCVLGQPGELDRPAWAGVCVSGLTSAIPPQPWISGWWCVREAATKAVEDETRNLLRLPTSSVRGLARSGSSSRLIPPNSFPGVASSGSSQGTHLPSVSRRTRRPKLSRRRRIELIFQLIRTGRPQLIFRRRIQDIFNSSDTDVLNSSSEDAFKTSSAHLTKTSSTRLPLVFPRRVRRMT
jgi:hypothetical protein